jgi:hypothetical protein
MKRCILEWDAANMPRLISMDGETIGYCSEWSIDAPSVAIYDGYVTRYERGQQNGKLVFETWPDFLQKLQTVETQNVEPIVKLQTEKFEFRNIEVS